MMANPFNVNSTGDKLNSIMTDRKNEQKSPYDLPAISPNRERKSPEKKEGTISHQPIKTDLNQSPLKPKVKNTPTIVKKSQIPTTRSPAL
jgi:hypothetical protein